MTDTSVDEIEGISIAEIFKIKNSSNGVKQPRDSNTECPFVQSLTKSCTSRWLSFLPRSNENAQPEDFRYETVSELGENFKSIIVEMYKKVLDRNTGEKEVSREQKNLRFLGEKYKTPPSKVMDIENKSELKDTGVCKALSNSVVNSPEFPIPTNKPVSLQVAVDKNNSKLVHDSIQKAVADSVKMNHNSCVPPQNKELNIVVESVRNNSNTTAVRPKAMACVGEKLQTSLESKSKAFSLEVEQTKTSSVKIAKVKNISNVEGISDKKTVLHTREKFSKCRTPNNKMLPLKLCEASKNPNSKNMMDLNTMSDFHERIQTSCVSMRSKVRGDANDSIIKSFNAPKTTPASSEEKLDTSCVPKTKKISLEEDELDVKLKKGMIANEIPMSHSSKTLQNSSLMSPTLNINELKDYSEMIKFLTISNSCKELELSPCVALSKTTNLASKDKNKFKEPIIVPEISLNSSEKKLKNSFPSLSDDHDILKVNMVNVSSKFSDSSTKIANSDLPSKTSCMKVCGDKSYSNKNGVDVPSSRFDSSEKITSSSDLPYPEKVGEEKSDSNVNATGGQNKNSSTSEKSQNHSELEIKKLLLQSVELKNNFYFRTTTCERKTVYDSKRIDENRFLIQHESQSLKKLGGKEICDFVEPAVVPKTFSDSGTLGASYLTVNKTSEIENESNVEIVDASKSVSDISKISEKILSVPTLSTKINNESDVSNVINMSNMKGGSGLDEKIYGSLCAPHNKYLSLQVGVKNNASINTALSTAVSDAECKTLKSYEPQHMPLYSQDGRDTNNICNVSENNLSKSHSYQTSPRCYVPKDKIFSLNVDVAKGISNDVPVNNPKGVSDSQKIIQNPCAFQTETLSSQIIDLKNRSNNEKINVVNTMSDSTKIFQNCSADKLLPLNVSMCKNNSIAETIRVQPSVNGSTEKGKKCAILFTNKTTYLINSNGEIFDIFKLFCGDTGDRTQNSDAFKNKMLPLKFEQVKTNSGNRTFTGPKTVFSQENMKNSFVDEDKMLLLKAVKDSSTMKTTNVPKTFYRNNQTLVIPIDEILSSEKKIKSNFEISDVLKKFSKHSENIQNSGIFKNKITPLKIQGSRNNYQINMASVPEMVMKHIDNFQKSGVLEDKTLSLKVIEVNNNSNVEKTKIPKIVLESNKNIRTSGVFDNKMVSLKEIEVNGNSSIETTSASKIVSENNENIETSGVLKNKLEHLKMIDVNDGSYGETTSTPKIVKRINENFQMSLTLENKTLSSEITEVKGYSNSETTSVRKTASKCDEHVNIPGVLEKQMLPLKVKDVKNDLNKETDVSEIVPEIKINFSEQKNKTLVGKDLNNSNLKTTSVSNEFSQNDENIQDYELLRDKTRASVVSDVELYPERMTRNVSKVVHDTSEEHQSLGANSNVEFKGPSIKKKLTDDTINSLESLFDFSEKLKNFPCEPKDKTPFLKPTEVPIVVKMNISKTDDNSSTKKKNTCEFQNKKIPFKVDVVKKKEIASKVFPTNTREHARNPWMLRKEAVSQNSKKGKGYSNTNISSDKEVCNFLENIGSSSISQNNTTSLKTCGVKNNSEAGKSKVLKTISACINKSKISGTFNNKKGLFKAGAIKNNFSKEKLNVLRAASKSREKSRNDSELKKKTTYLEEVGYKPNSNSKTDDVINITACKSSKITDVSFIHRNKNSSFKCHSRSDRKKRTVPDSCLKAKISSLEPVEYPRHLFRKVSNHSIAEKIKVSSMASGKNDRNYHFLSRKILPSAVKNDFSTRNVNASRAIPKYNENIQIARAQQNKMSFFEVCEGKKTNTETTRVLKVDPASREDAKKSLVRQAEVLSFNISDIQKNSSTKSTHTLKTAFTSSDDIRSPCDLKSLSATSDFGVKKFNVSKSFPDFSEETENASAQTKRMELINVNEMKNKYKVKKYVSNTPPIDIMLNSCVLPDPRTESTFQEKRKNTCEESSLKRVKWSHDIFDNKPTDPRLELSSWKNSSPEETVTVPLMVKDSSGTKSLSLSDVPNLLKYNSCSCVPSCKSSDSHHCKGRTGFLLNKYLNINDNASCSGNDHESLKDSLSPEMSNNKSVLEMEIIDIASIDSSDELSKPNEQQDSCPKSPGTYFSVLQSEKLRIRCDEIEKRFGVKSYYDGKKVGDYNYDCRYPEDMIHSPEKTPTGEEFSASIKNGSKMEELRKIITGNKEEVIDPSEGVNLKFSKKPRVNMLQKQGSEKYDLSESTNVAGSSIEITESSPEKLSLPEYKMKRQKERRSSNKVSKTWRINKSTCLEKYLMRVHKLVQRVGEQERSKNAETDGDKMCDISSMDVKLCEPHNHSRD